MSSCSVYSAFEIYNYGLCNGQYCSSSSNYYYSCQSGCCANGYCEQNGSCTVTTWVWIVVAFVVFALILCASIAGCIRRKRM